MLNSLYGKFGQKVRKNEKIGDCDVFDIRSMPALDNETGEIYRETRFGGNIYRSSVVETESQNSFPAIASFCTTYARMKLLEAVEIAGWENVYYVDTDSLFVNDVGKKRLMESGLVHPKELGKLKFEYQTKGMLINGCKDYITHKNINPIISNVVFMKDEIKIKGVPNKAVKLGDNEYQLTKFNKFRTSVKNGCLDSVIQSTMIKELSRQYTKGLVDESGRVIPICLSEGLIFDAD